MVVGEYWWLIYLVFLAIPLSRIIPRVISRNKQSNRYFDNNAYDNNDNTSRDAYNTASTTKKPDNPISNDNINKEQRRKQFRSTHTHSSNEPNADSLKGQTDEMVVLGAIHRGAKTFEKIQRKINFDDKRLNIALENLEDKKLIHIIEKNGLLGAKVEIHPTDKGFQKYYS